MARRKTDLSTTLPPAATADEVADGILAILKREVDRYGRIKRALKPGEVDLLVRVLDATHEVVRFQIDPFGPALRKRMATMTEAELAAARARLAGDDAGRPS
jgi:hypothetical protein